VKAVGGLKKMKVELAEQVAYHLELSERIWLNDYVGREIELHWSGIILCTRCGKKTQKSFGEGFCYPCFQSAPEAAPCIIKPELCRAHLGEGRDPEWEQLHHNTDHIVYLAATNAVKVGITRSTQVPTRWIDQGASSAIKLAVTPNRYEAGRIEVALKDFFTDKTNWQRMLKNDIDETIDLVEEKWQVHDQLPSDIQQFFAEDDELVTINYPVLTYPQQLKSISFDTLPTVRGKLMGIKGQYLMLEGGIVFNVRKHTGYQVEWEM
jgi:hypothetical protein